MKNIVKFSIVFGFVCFLSSASTAALNSGLVAYYPFENNFNDSSIFENHGIQHGGMAFMDGIIGRAASFDGLDDYVEALSRNQLNISQVVSFSVWVNLSGGKTGGAIVGKGPSGARYARNYMFFVWGGDKVLIQFCEETYYEQFEYRLEILPISSVNWHHIVGILNTLNYQWAFYVDGEKVTGQTIVSSPFSMPTNDYNLMIGAADNLPPSTPPRFFFQGLMDELRIYNRHLTESEIRQLYQQGAVGIAGAGPLLPLILDQN